MIAAVVEAVATELGRDVQLQLDGRAVEADPAVAAVEVDAEVVRRHGPWLPGFVRELTTTADHRHAAGVHHTPPAVVAAVLDLAEQAGLVWGDDTTVLDPAVGGGAFLLAAAGRMQGPRRDVVARLRGVDIDPLAIATTRAALHLWADVAAPDDAFVVGDFLDDDLALEPVDVVIGNPPFLAQLKGETIRTEHQRARIADRWPGVGRYVDEAMTFALASADLVEPDGWIVLVEPASVLGAGDAATARAHLDAVAPLVGLWVDRERAFAAAVDTVAIVCRRGRSGSTVRLGERTFDRPSPSSWAPLLAAAHGVPPIAVEAGRTLGDIANVTAGFRDQYYGLRGAVADDPEAAHPLITSGSIDPLHNRWGERPTRFDKTSFDHPTVDLARVDPKIGAWVRARLVPKVLVASQTRVVEAIVDPEGVMVPGTPVVSVEPADTTVWHIAALLTSPVASALLAAAAAGTALSADAVRVSARTLAELPLPDDEVAWADAAGHARRGDVVACGKAMLLAHRCDDREDLLAWWRTRIPTTSLGI